MSPIAPRRLRIATKLDIPPPSQHIRSKGSSQALPAALITQAESLVMRAFLHGTVHVAAEDLQAALRSDPRLLPLWEILTPLGRNEFICWIEDAKQAKTRQRRIARTCEELLEGKRRPCCWAGCTHRDDKPPSRWQQAILTNKDQ